MAVFLLQDTGRSQPHKCWGKTRLDDGRKPFPPERRHPPQTVWRSPAWQRAARSHGARFPENLVSGQGRRKYDWAGENAIVTGNKALRPVPYRCRAFSKALRAGGQRDKWPWGTERPSRTGRRLCSRLQPLRSAALSAEGGPPLISSAQRGQGQRAHVPEQLWWRSWNPKTSRCRRFASRELQEVCSRQDPSSGQAFCELGFRRGEKASSQLCGSDPANFRQSHFPCVVCIMSHLQDDIVRGSETKKSGNTSGSPVGYHLLSRASPDSCSWSYT